MNLKSLELNGFKSFGKKTILEFTTPITSIVGPNGSGKSNVAESFRFVLGEQSIKSMRGKKGEDLIFNGSSDAGRSNRASVKLCFDNKKRLFNVDFDEVTIERVVYRDGVNEYSINGSKVRLKDITELLSSAHIGSSGHHIISQGEADRILHTSPKERKEMIEDALGIKIYQYKKEESVRKLEKTDENIKQVESLRREIAPHLKFLKRQVEKIEKSKQIREELIFKSKEYFALEEAHINFEKQNSYRERQAPEQELKDLQAKLKQARLIIEESQKGTDESSKILELEGKLGASRRHKDEIVRELGRIEGEISYIIKTISIEKQNMENSGKPVPVSEIEILANEIKEEIQKAESVGTLEIFKETLHKVGNILSTFINNSKTSTSPALERLQGELETLRSKEKSLQENFN
ncbi:MAG: AAA family ATPase, partial [Candidatus Paceibacterota bacterium]